MCAQLGIRCVVDMNLFAEFAITVTIPFVGLVLIYLMYRGRLSYISAPKAAADVDDIGNDETVKKKTDDSAEYALSVRRAADWAAWLAIGWLFLVSGYLSLVH